MRMHQLTLVPTICTALSIFYLWSAPALAFRVWGLEGATISVLIERDGSVVCDTTEQIGDAGQVCIEEFKSLSDFGGSHSYKINGDVIFADGNVRSFSFVDPDFDESTFGNADCVPVLLRQPADSYLLQVSIACGG